MEGFFSFDDFRNCLEGLEKFQSCNHEADAEDQIQRLKMELRFLMTFSKCIARDENLKSSLEAAVSSDCMSLFSSSEDEMCQISSALQVFVEMRSKVACFYDQISLTSPSYIPMSNELVAELINDLMQNLEDLLLLLLRSSEVNSVVNVNVNIKNQISVLRKRLQFVKNFLDFVLARPQCCELEIFKKLLARSEAMAVEAARTSYSCFANQSTEESTFEIEHRLSDLLEKIKPSNSELREMYIGVMEGTKSSESSDSCMRDKIVLGPFLDSLHELLLEIPTLDQPKVLETELRFIRALLVDPPGKEYTGPENLNDLFRSIESLATEFASLVFSLYNDEMGDDLTTQMNIAVVNLLEKMKYIKFKGREIYLNSSKPCRSKVPKTDGLGFIQYLLENLEELLSHGDNTISLLKHHIKTVQQEFEFLIPLLKKMERQINKHEKFRSLWIRAVDAAYHAEYIIDSFVMKDGPTWYYMFCLDDIVDELLVVKADVLDINSQVPSDTGVPSNDETNDSDSGGALFAPANSPTTSTNVQLVGFEDAVEKITDLLIKGCGGQLDIISIVGMPGLGKTTLSKKLYNSTLVEKHFHVRAWCCVSQVYQKKDLFLSVLGNIIDLKDDHHKMEVEVLAAYLRQKLMAKRYLVVMDDIWDIEAWRDLQEAFPNTKHGSRIIFTTRIRDVALKAKLLSDPYFLRPLDDKESWILLQQSLLSKDGCPSELGDTGKQIASSCAGLPLSVVLIARLLSTDMTLGFWEQVAKTFSLRITSDEQSRTLDIIGLSYQHLPDHLKPCFLYLGAFLEGQEIPAKNLIQLWCAEGFVRRVEGKRIEETARDFLQDLINRSLLAISKHGADGGIKACRIHDLLSHFCKTKAKEENFWQLIDGYDDLFPSDVIDHDVSSDFYCSSTPIYEQRRLCIYSKRNQFVMSKPSGSHVRSLLLIAAKDDFPHCSYDVSFICNNFKLLRVLNLKCLNLGDFPNGLELLVQLRYLALWVDAAFVPSTLSYLWNLETLILEGGMIVILPESIWNMKKLRHLRASKLATFNVDNEINELGTEGTECAPPVISSSHVQSKNLENLQTISTLSFTKGREEETLKKIPNIRKLSCVILDAMDGSSDDDCCHFPALELLDELESANVFFAGSMLPPLQEIIFPIGLKKLTFSCFNMDWSKISIIGTLENLEVLKLRENAFEGRLWNMEVGEFPKLKHLELYRMNLEEWNASSDNFCCLQKVRLISCADLEIIPTCFGELDTLEMIEVKWCPDIEAEWIRGIEEDQVENGNCHFKAFIQTDDDSDDEYEYMFGDSDDEYAGPVSVFF